METDSADVAPLSAEEQADWDTLLERGRRIADEKRGVREAAAMEKLKADRPGARFGTDVFRRKRKRGLDVDGSPEPGTRTKRWIVARAAGMTPKEASASAGCTWRELMAERNRNPMVRFAIDAMNEVTRERMKAMAYGVVEESLDGRDVPKMSVHTAKWALERLESSRFADPRTSRPQEGEVVNHGGIAIYLVDTSKRQPVPDPASLGVSDSEMKGVEV